MSEVTDHQGHLKSLVEQQKTLSTDIESTRAPKGLNENVIKTCFQCFKRWRYKKRPLLERTAVPLPVRLLKLLEHCRNFCDGE